MQRLAVPRRKALLAMEKEVGTPIDFTDARMVDLERFIFQDEIFGVYAYQGVPVTVDAATRNNFVNGDMEDLRSALLTNGMELQYARISWNEDVVGPNYYITDLAVGVIVRCVSYINQGPNRLITAMSHVGWYQQLISKLVMPWKSWVLFVAVEGAEPFNRWSWDAISGKFQLSSLTGVPSPPATDETRSHFINDGKVDAALGAFVRMMLDEGYQVTLLEYKVSIGYERVRVWQYRDRTYAEYRTHTRLSVDFTSIPECFLAESPIVITTATAWAIAKCIALIIVAAGVFFALQNLTTTEKSYEKWGWVQDPDTGEWEWRLIERGYEKGALVDWTMIIIAGIIAVTAVVVVTRLM